MCAGIRDADNLGWKLAAVCSGRADPALLDTYQREREPHVRATIAMAIMMGRTVCISDPEAACARDAQMLAARAAGQAQDGAVSYPPIAAGAILAGSPGAGSYFPQFVADGARADDLLGTGPWLLAVDDPRLAKFVAQLAGWLAQFQAEAVLVRPDRHVFGTGTPTELAAAWSEVVAGQPENLA